MKFAHLLFYHLLLSDSGERSAAFMGFASDGNSACICCGEEGIPVVAVPASVLVSTPASFPFPFSSRDTIFSANTIPRFVSASISFRWGIEIIFPAAICSVVTDGLPISVWLPSMLFSLQALVSQALLQAEI
jgi:hypothetical protein